MLVRKANWEAPDWKQSDLGLCCLSWPFWPTARVQITDHAINIIVTFVFLN